MPEHDERLARFEARTETLLTQLEKRMSDGFAAMDRRFDDVHRRIDDLQHRLQGLDSRFTVLEAKVEARFVSLDDKVDGRVTDLRTAIDGKASSRALTGWMMVAVAWMTVLATGVSSLLVWLVGRLP